VLNGCASGMDVAATGSCSPRARAKHRPARLRRRRRDGRVEEPTYHNVLAVLVSLGLRAAPVPMKGGCDPPPWSAPSSALVRLYTMPTPPPLGSTPLGTGARCSRSPPPPASR
jgi:hypothetical protein